MSRGRIGLFGTKKSKKSLQSDIEADDFIAQLFEQELDFPEFSDSPIETSALSNNTNAKKSKSSTKTSSKSTKSSQKSTSKTSKTSKVKASRTKSTKTARKTKAKAKKSSNESTISSFVLNYDELLATLAAHSPHITLLDNIITPQNILINYDVTIDFNGFSIISDESQSVMRVLDIRSGKVILTGKGKIFAMGKQGVAIRAFGAISSGVPNYTNLTVGPEISLFAPDSYGILISPNLGVAYGLTISFSGQIFAHDGIGLAGAIRADDRHLPTINILEGAHIVADETVGVAIEAAGYGQWGITNARLSGAAAASLSMGELSFLNSQLIARDITFSLCPSAAQTLKLTVDGGTYVAERGANISGEKSSTTKLSLKSGNFYAPELLITKNLKPLLKTKGRTKFSKNVAKILAELIPTPAEDEIHLDTSEVPATTNPSVQSEPETISDPATTSEPGILTEPEHIPESNVLVEPTDISASEIAQEPIPPIEPAIDTIPSESSVSTLASSVMESNPNATIQPEPSWSMQPESPVPEPSITTPSEPVISYPQHSTITTPATPPAFSQATSSFAAYPPSLAASDEQVAARAALADAINDIRKLNAEDYGANFSYLEQTILRAEQVLNNPYTTLQDIFTAASELLQAFDNLQENDNSSLSDDELDELFYHGAVLEEMVNEPQDELTSAVIDLTLPGSTHSSKSPHSSHTQLSNGISPTAVANQLSLQAQSYDETEAAATDFGKMVSLLNLIADLDLNRYLATSQTSLLEALAEAEEILNDPSCSQEEVDDITERITDGLQELELVRLAHLSGRSRRTRPKLNIPAPSAHQPVPIIMIDETSPAPNWSTGVVMIDEMNPYIADPDTLEKMIRATRPVIAAFFDTITSPARKLSRSLSAGFRAGLTVYRETLHAAKG